MTENGSSRDKSGSGLRIAGIILLVLAGAAAFLSFGPDETLQEAEVTSVVTPAQNTAPAPLESPQPAAREAEEAEAEQPTGPAPEETPAAAEAQPAPADAPAQTAGQATSEPASPSIDEVRVDGSGLVVIAGRGAPGSTVDVVVDGEVVTSAEVDQSGSFAALGSVGTNDSARSLTVQSGAGEETVTSVEEIIIAPIRPANRVAEDQAAPSEVVGDSAQTETPQTVQAADSPAPAEQQVVSQATSAEETGQAAAAESATGADETQVTAADDIATQARPLASATNAAEEVATVLSDPETSAPAVSQTGQAQAAAPAEVPSTSEQPAQQDEPAAASEAEPADRVAVLRSDAEGVTLLPTEAGPAAQVVLDTIGYSDEGVVQLSGRASAEAVEVRVYLDNAPVARLPVDGSGGWRGTVPGVAPGIYKLRIDALTAEGTVSSRLETPFKREAPAVLAAATDRNDADGPVRAVTVQTGDTLWAIARERYGEGILYVQVFEANRGSIRDPDLIYPGQIFDLPGD